MAEWYVKDLSQLTKVSVQTLHYYDRIRLLKPSLRLPNGYRVYSEKDLLKLQQIIALKFFGFELSQIRRLLSEEVNILDHFSVQAQFLEEKARTLLDATQALKNIISDCKQDKSIPWETIIKLIEVYQMTQQLEKTWVGQVLTPDELKEYAKFSQDLKTRFTEEVKKDYEDEWADIVNQVNENLDQNPEGPLGIAIGRRCMNWVNRIYTADHAGLRTAIWEKGFKEGHGADEHGLSPQAVAWLDQAHGAYYKDRITKVFDQVGKAANESVKKTWNELVKEMFGDDKKLKADFIQELLKDETISKEVKLFIQRT